MNKGDLPNLPDVRSAGSYGVKQQLQKVVPDVKPDWIQPHLYFAPTV